MNDNPTSRLPAPREPAPVTPESLQTLLASTHYYTAFDGSVQSGANMGEQSDVVVRALQHTMICTLVFRNGFAVTGSAMCLSRPDYDEGEARAAAKSEAIQQAVQYAHFLDRQRMHEAPAPKPPETPINSPDGEKIVQLRRST